MVNYTIPKMLTKSTGSRDCPPPIIVIGMHRSGTSLVTELLRELGVHIGMKLDNHNESECFKRINQHLLQDQDAYWSDPLSFVSQLDSDKFVETSAKRALELFDKWKECYGQIGSDQLWGWKDPRNTLTLPIWLKLFPEAKVIHVVRNGIDVAISLRKRDLISWLLSILRARRGNYKRLTSPTIVPAYRLWEEYLQIGLSLESLCASCLRLRYEDITSHPRRQIGALCDFLAIDVTDEIIASLSQSIIREPKKRSLINQMEARLWFRLGVLNPDLLMGLGYKAGVEL